MDGGGGIVDTQDEKEIAFRTGMPKNSFAQRDTVHRSLVAASVLVAVMVTSLLRPDGALAQPKGAVGAGSASAVHSGQISDENRREAAERFKRGVQLQSDGNLDAAVIEFERAYELAPAYQVLFNIAVVYRDKNDRASALRAFERYLSEGGSKIDAKKRKDVEIEISKLKDVVATLRVKVNIQGATIFLDDFPVGKSPLSESLLVNVGRHKIEAKKDGFKDDSLLFVLAGRDNQTIELKLSEIKKEPVVVAPSPSPTAPPPTIIIAPPTATAPAESGTSLKGIGYTLGTLGIIGIGVGSYFGLSARADWNKAKDLGCTDGKCPSKSAQDKSKSARDSANLSTLGFGVGGVALIAGVVLFLTSDGDPPQSAEQKKIQISPSLGKHEGGVVLGGTF